VFQEYVPPAALPKTFQDAINMAGFLEIEFLWIDSLCILQDDVDDWAKESSLMTNVYDGSYVNIVAPGAIDGSVGCFFYRNTN
jgi:hypothetical protein